MTKWERIRLALDILFGTMLYSDCYPTEPISSYVWRRGKTSHIKAIDWAAQKFWGEIDHCKVSYQNSKARKFDAPEYR